MIFGFEQETAPLNDVEKSAAQVIATCMQQAHVGAERAVTAQHICNALANWPQYRDAKGRPYLNGARIRKIVNHIRLTGACPGLLANSKGYYVSTDREEVQAYIDSLKERANAIYAVANKMQAVL